MRPMMLMPSRPSASNLAGSLVSRRPVDMEVAQHHRGRGVTAFVPAPKKVLVAWSVSRQRS
jgi:hypothetical protein